jgi:hypothetical protein
MKPLNKGAVPTTMDITRWIAASRSWPNVVQEQIRRKLK